MSAVDELKQQIRVGRIVFDPPPSTSARLRQELLGENNGTQVTPLLQRLVLELSRLNGIRISSIIRDSGHHGAGRAVDIGNEKIAGTLLPIVATDDNVQELDIDELIFDASVAGAGDRNRWNYDRGQKHDYNRATLNGHRDHIHFSVKPG